MEFGITAIVGTVVSLLLIGAVVMGLFLSFIWRRVVPTNMVHIVQSSRKTVSYGRGREAGNTYYAIPSWVPKFGVTVTQFPESIFDITLKDYEAYDIGRLPFIVDIRAFFRISDSQAAANRVANFTELQNQLMGVLQGAVRRILATNKLEQIMQDRSSLGEQFTTEVDEQLKEWGVGTVKMIEFMDIKDSKDSRVIANMMEKEKSRIEMESRVTVASNRREAETKEIEANREVALTRTQAEQEVGIRKALADQEVGIAQEKSTQQVTLESKATAERQMEVRRVQDVQSATIQKEVAVVEAERDQQVAVVKAKTDKESQIIRAEAERDTTVKIADGKLQATLKDSEGVKALGSAKATAEKEMLLAPVTAQITLAEQIGGNEGYQRYLIDVRRIEASESVGKEMAGAMAKADLKVIANSGDVQSGVGNLMDVFTAKGGTAIGAMLTALSQTDEGRALVQRVVAGTTEQNNSDKIAE